VYEPEGCAASVILLQIWSVIYSAGQLKALAFGLKYIYTNIIYILSQVLIATSTLAWGVNFPAHLVVVKGTEYFDGKTKRYVDYPITGTQSTPCSLIVYVVWVSFFVMPTTQMVIRLQCIIWRQFHILIISYRWYEIYVYLWDFCNGQNVAKMVTFPKLLLCRVLSDMCHLSLSLPSVVVVTIVCHFPVTYVIWLFTFISTLVTD